MLYPSFPPHFKMRDKIWELTKKEGIEKQRGILKGKNKFYLWGSPSLAINNWTIKGVLSIFMCYLFFLMFCPEAASDIKHILHLVWAFSFLTSSRSFFLGETSLLAYCSSTFLSVNLIKGICLNNGELWCSGSLRGGRFELF